MNYAWEAALMADRDGIAREQLLFEPVHNGSPYTEVVNEMININDLESALVEINPLYRFSGVFSELLSRDVQAYEQARKLIFRVYVQYMVQLDLRQGLSRQEYILRFILKDILKEVCGSQAACVLKDFEKNKLRRLLRFIYKLYQCGSSISLFREVMRSIYSDSIVYACNEEVRQLLIYVGTKETQKERERLAFLQDMFLPINFHIYLFWEHHFGIIDVDETMELDEMVLF